MAANATHVPSTLCPLASWLHIRHNSPDPASRYYSVHSLPYLTNLSIISRSRTPLLMKKNPVTGGGDDGPPYTDSYTAIKEQPSSASSTSPPRPTSLFQRIPKRYIMCVLILLSNILCYADRTNISIAVLPGNIPLADNTDKGQVLASFFYGYVCTQLLGGLLSVRFGGKPVLIVGVCLWVICDGLTVPASSVFPLLLMARIGMGLGEGVNFPADHAMVAAWFVEQERSAFLTIVSAGVDIGTIVSSGLSPLIASQLGWKWSTHANTPHTPVDHRPL